MKTCIFCLLMASFSARGVYGQEGFTGPGSSSRQIQTVTAAQAKKLPDDTLVVLTGTIVQALGDEKYIFRDSTGDITVEIDRKIWRGLSVGASDTVEISGEVDIDWDRGTVLRIDVKNIRKL